MQNSSKPIEIVLNFMPAEDLVESPLTSLASRLKGSNIATPTTTKPRPDMKLKREDSENTPTHELEINTDIGHDTEDKEGFFINSRQSLASRKRGTKRSGSPIKHRKNVGQLSSAKKITKLSPLCHSSALNLDNNSDELELFGFSQDTISSNLNDASKNDSLEKTESSHDSVYSSPQLSPLFSEAELSELFTVKSTEEDVESDQPELDFGDLSFEAVDQLTPERKKSDEQCADMDADQEQDNSNPVITDLLFNEIKSKLPESKKSARKCLDMDSCFTKATNLKASASFASVSSLITTPDRVCFANIINNIVPAARPQLKRLEPLETSPVKSAKKIKCEQETKIPMSSIPKPVQQVQQHHDKTIFRKSISVDEAAMRYEDKNMTADFCYELCLPILAKSKHADLKSITPDTLQRLLNGEFDHVVASYKIVDCRYPYEFEGGHIRGAINLYMENQIDEEFVKVQPSISHVGTDGKRNIIIFHCEFSSERGPRQYRHLRNLDRIANAYPLLQYPEIYLLEGGYKAFFEAHESFCEPKSYRPMLDSNFSALYQTFRARSKRSGYAGETGNRSMKSRSRLNLN